jgi:hypothetical protein
MAERQLHGLQRVLGVDALPQPVTQTEAGYESVLVAPDAHHYSPSTIATAAQLAGRKRRGIDVLVLAGRPCRVIIESEPTVAHA